MRQYKLVNDISRENIISKRQFLLYNHFQLLHLLLTCKFRIFLCTFHFEFHNISVIKRMHAPVDRGRTEPHASQLEIKVINVNVP